MSNKKFPDELKLGDVTPIYKKDDPNKSKNYRPVSVLSVVSKFFEKIMHDQISQYTNSFLTPYLCGYRRLEHDPMLAIEGFEKNCMKLNQDLCHFLLPGHKHEVMLAKIGHSKIWENCT